MAPHCSVYEDAASVAAPQFRRKHFTTDRHVTAWRNVTLSYIDDAFKLMNGVAYGYKRSHGQVRGNAPAVLIAVFIMDVRTGGAFNTPGTAYDSCLSCIGPSLPVITNTATLVIVTLRRGQDGRRS
ncbi:hypothetical protein CBL_07432 [Carabus blaptoides fortunei]